MFPSLRFRRATLQDVPALLALMADFNAFEGVDWSADRCDPALRRLLGDPSLGLVELLEADGELAGYYVVTWGYDLEWDGRDAFLTELYVAPARRGRGHGRALLRRTEQSAMAHGARALHLMVRLENDVARGLYQQAGYASPPRLFLSKVLRDCPDQSLEAQDGA